MEGKMISFILNVVGGLIAVTFLLYIAYHHYTWNRNAEARGIPLESHVPQPTSEQQRYPSTQTRRELATPEGGAALDGAVVLGPPNAYTRDGNSRWFRRTQSDGSCTSTATASSAVVYGRGRYLSPRRAPSDTLCTHSGRLEQQHEGEEESGLQKRCKRRRRHAVGEGHSPYGGWGVFGSGSNSGTSSGSGSSRSGSGSHDGCFTFSGAGRGANTGQRETEKHVAVAVAAPRDERHRATQRRVIEQNTAMSGFFTSPEVEWSREPVGSQQSIPYGAEGR